MGYNLGMTGVVGSGVSNDEDSPRPFNGGTFAFMHLISDSLHMTRAVRYHEGCRAGEDVRDGTLNTGRIWPSNKPTAGTSEAGESGKEQGFMRSRAEGSKVRKAM